MLCHEIMQLYYFTSMYTFRGYSSLDNQSTLAKYPDEHSALLSSVNRSAAKVDPFRGMSARRYADEEDIHGMGGVEDLISRGGQRSNQPEQRTPSADSSSHLVVSNPLSAVSEFVIFCIMYHLVVLCHMAFLFGLI